MHQYKSIPDRILSELLNVVSEAVAIKDSVVSQIYVRTYTMSQSSCCSMSGAHEPSSSLPASHRLCVMDGQLCTEHNQSNSLVQTLEQIVVKYYFPVITRPMTQIKLTQLVDMQRESQPFINFQY